MIKILQYVFVAFLGAGVILAVGYFAIQSDHDGFYWHSQVSDFHPSVTIHVASDVALNGSAPTMSYALLDRPAPHKAAKRQKPRSRVTDPAGARASQTSRRMRSTHRAGSAMRCNAAEPCRSMCCCAEKKGRS
jgi:hypothetical protein